MKLIDFTLPEFAFLDANTHLGNLLEGRTVIMHVRTNTIFEAIALDEVKEIQLNAKTYEFTYHNFAGIEEQHVLALHYSFADDDEFEEIAAKTAKWYADYLTWEDRNIIEESKGGLN